MPASRQHAEWLSLVEVSGPFVSVPVLDRVFPQGLDAHDPEHLKRLRTAYEEWEDGWDDPAIHRAWVEFVLTEGLEFPEELLRTGPAIPPGIEARVPEHHETLRPDYVLVNPKGVPNEGKCRLLIRVVPPDQDLDKPETGSTWKASPDTRMMELCHAAGVPLGLVTNGEQWMLVYAPVGETTGYTSWYAHLWLEEHLTLRAWRSLLCTRRFFGVADGETIEFLLAESAKNQQEVTDQLGLQVRQAVELFVQTIDRIDMDRDRKVLAEITPEELYEASLTVMMRLVFLFCAEERGLILLGDPIYDQFYAVSTLSAILRETADQQGEEILERRYDAWGRLLATFRVVFGGVQHENMRLQPYGGSLFDPDRFPFLEGRPKRSKWQVAASRPLPVDNRTVLHLMEALQFLQVGGERQRLSFRALDIEQIGHVYEGLLDHTVLRAPEDEIIVSIAGKKGDEPEVAIRELERELAKGEDGFIAYVKNLTGRSPNALRNDIVYVPDPERQQRLRVACANDEAILDKVLPFAGIVRDDTFGHPVVIPGGSFYVTQGSERRKTGTHYTPRSLTEPIVQYTLEPVVYEGPAEGWDREKWRLKSAQEILALKVCDMAMGSGAFLVQVVRYLSERLVEAWDAAGATSGAESEDDVQSPLDVATKYVMARTSSRKVREIIERESATEAATPADEEAHRWPAPRITVQGSPSTGAPSETIIPDDPDERLTLARRIVCDRCIYGVDINPLAVEMAKLSLWLITMDKGRAFTFLDHALKCGDALLGLWDVEQVYKFHLDPEVQVQGGLWGDHVRAIFEFAMAKRRELESFTVIDVRDREAKARLLAEADAAMEVVRLLCDQLIAAAVISADGESKRRGAMMPESFEKHRHRIFDQLMEANNRAEIESAVDAVRALAVEGKTLLNSRNPNKQAPRGPFHWPLEYPEIFATESATAEEPAPAAGFAAVVGNPPFQGGQRITGAVGTDYRFYLMDALAGGQKGSADLCAYFFLRAKQIIGRGGGFGLLATNTIAQGDTREVGLDQLTKSGFVIPRAIASRKWPGTANLEVAHVWMRNGEWKGGHVLEDKPVKGITPYLVIPGKVTGTPYRLAANAGKSFQGSIVLGMGFIMSPGEAQALIEKDARNKDVLYPYLNGEDLNSRPDQSPSRWVINFHDWPLDRSAPGSWEDADEKERKKYLQIGRVPPDYPDPVAADYPDCLAIIEEKVKPERVKNKRKVRREKWWQYAERAPQLYATIADMERFLVHPLTSKHNCMAFYRPGVVSSHMTVILAMDGWHEYALLQSELHWVWVLQHGNKLENRPQYTPSDCFETFPFPNRFEAAREVGEECYCGLGDGALSKAVGLREIWNLINDQKEGTSDVMQLRNLKQMLDLGIADAYGWTDLDLDHDFHETKQGIRFTISEAARRDVLDRLLALNHERYAEEVAQGLHVKGAKKKGGKRAKKIRSTSAQGDLF